ncbi:arginase family protein [Coniochaeta ligniaria NRRL 30616]|uniref:Arginase family protein n=1 Tax=Coniochaeta ligniaria NRRL 30616 TaxID=1408157 RepID=A0A1J7JES2_9PEZI|nr:arginase family protein [Coniochaeta ligniaria NRRL 30616]
MRANYILPCAIISQAVAWEFPRIAFAPREHTQHQFTLEDKDDIDIITGSQFNGLKTFANLPYVNCFSDTEAKGKKYDIAIMGAPFDTSVTARPGARYGPGGIRIGSQRMGNDGAWSVYTGENIWDDWATIIDCGDAPLTWLDNNVAFKQLDKAHLVVSGREASNTSVSQTPRILTLGGDHATTLSALRSTYQRWGPVSVIHFDSHIDTWDPDVLGGGISHYAGINHGTFLHIAHEEGLVLNTSIHAGIRAPLIRKKGDIRNDKRCGFDIITARDLDTLGTAGVIAKIKQRVGTSKVYVSVDVDVLDPAFAPATGTAEPGGWTSRELLTVLDGLRDLSVVGADVVEVAPVYDNPGETTVLVAAEVGRSLLALMVGTPVKSLADAK